MFEKLKNKIKSIQDSMTIKISESDLKQFNDPMAEKIDWQPLKAGGANFKTSVLKKLSSSLYCYQLSVGGKLFIALFAMIGVIIFIVGLSTLFNKAGVHSIFLMLFGMIFSGVSYWMYQIMGKPIYFDGSMGMIWKGKKPPQLSGVQTKNTDLIYFSEVHALQILSERVSSKNGSYQSYEINLVLKDGKRVNLVDHGNHAQILIDAEDLSELLGKSLWDVT